MPNFFKLAAFLLLCNTCLAQTPFIQANNTKSKPTVKLDTTRLNLTDKVDAVSRIVDGITLDTSITDILLKSLKEKKFQEIKAENDSINRKVDNIQSKIEELKNHNQKSEKEINELEKKLAGSQQVDELKSKIDRLRKVNRQNEQELKKLDGKLKSSQQEKEQSDKKLMVAEKEKESLSQELSSSERKILILTNEGHGLQIKNFKHSLSDLKDTIDSLSKDLDKVEENNIKLRKWRENKLLGEDDDRNVLDLYTKMVRQNDEGIKSIKDLQSNINGIEEQIKKFEENKGKIDIIIAIDSNLVTKNILNKIVEEQRKLQKDINLKVFDLNKNLESSREKIKNIQSETNNNQQAIIKIYKTYKAVETPKEDNVKAISGITQPLSEYGQLVPNISLLGYREVKNENSNRSALLKLFIAPNTGKNSTFNNAYRLLIPEASNYGFLADFSFGFIPSTNSFKADKDTGQPVKKLGLNLSAYYLGKSLVKKDSSAFNSGMMHFKVGAQYIVIGKVLSIYSNINTFYITNGVKDFQDTYTGYENKMRSFVDFGLNAYLNLSSEAKQSDFFIDLDLGFVAVGGDIKPLVSTTDPLIPRIKISLVKGFRF